MPELAWISVVEAAGRIARGALSPVELVQACLDQIERHEKQLNCFIRVCTVDALAAAREPSGGPLHGVPIAVKDNVETAGVHATGGSKIMADHVPTADAPAWARLRAAGGILLGKTNLHEFGMGPTNLNPHYGHTRNPWDPARVPGGSSGGSAAAVAAGMAPAALGTDAGGSVRIPAALCGVVGLKGTHGRVPTRGGIAFGNPTVDHIGPITRTVADAALLLELMSGYDAADPTSVDAAPVAMAAAAARGAGERSLRGLTVGVPTVHYFDPAHPGVVAAVRAAIGQIEALGARVRDVDLPDHAALIDGLSGLSAEGLVWHRGWLRTRLADYHEPTQVRLLAAQFILGRDLATAQRVRRLLRQRYDAALTEVDLIAAPTVPIPAPTIREAEADAFAVGGTLGDASALSRNTRPANLTGLPSISVPCGLADGLPVGLMLLGRAFDEETVIRAAAAYEATTDWHTLRPALSPRPPGEG